MVNGWQLVPIEPTAEMIEAGREEMSLGDETLYPDDMRLKWLAMLAAAPKNDEIERLRNEVQSLKYKLDEC